MQPRFVVLLGTSNNVLLISTFSCTHASVTSLTNVSMNLSQTTKKTLNLSPETLTLFDEKDNEKKDMLQVA